MATGVTYKEKDLGLWGSVVGRVRKSPFPGKENPAEAGFLKCSALTKSVLDH